MFASVNCANHKCAGIDTAGITKSISRFSRNTVTLLETVRELKELGISVYFEEQSIDTATADGELMLSILASYAQEESLSASENQKWRVKRNFEEGIDNVRVLINALGYKVLEPTVQKASDLTDEDEKLYLNTGAVRAVGIVTPEGFVLLAGSKINEKASEKSLNKGAIALRKKHFDAGRVKDLTTTEDILFSSSSAAADFVTGYSVSGPAMWKNAVGKPLKEIESR